MTVKFSKPIHPVKDYELIRNSTIWVDGKLEPALDLKIIPSELVGADKLSFTWEIEEITKNEMTIQLYFENPPHIGLDNTDPEYI